MNKHPFTILLTLIVFSSLLGGCRYWSLYKFGDQFCSFKQHIEVSSHETDKRTLQSQISFIDPVLPQSVFLRYLDAQAFSSADHPYTRHDNFMIQRSGQKDHMGNLLRPTSFDFQAEYSLGTKKPLLSGGVLGSELSSLFTPELITPILKSICADDYDLSLKRIDIRFELNDLDKNSLPAQSHFIDTFGEPDAISNQTLHYRFDFISPPSPPAETANTETALQNRPIQFLLNFNQYEQLSKIHILYYKYDYLLDFENLNGRLIAIRSE